VQLRLIPDVTRAGTTVFPNLQVADVLPELKFNPETYIVRKKLMNLKKVEYNSKLQ
jgi:hypothetical protein